MSAKTAVIAEKKKEHRKNFIEIFDKISYSHGKYNVWRDFIYMCAAALSQPLDFKQDREDEYLRIIKSYNKETQELFAEMFSELTLIYEEEGFGDILGETYASAGMTNDKNGQFFTPYHICKFMAGLQGDAEGLTAEIERKGYISVSDPCSGAGAMLIAFADHCMECGINYQQSVLFVAQDIDHIAALMCYVQMALLGMPGYVIIGNSLIPSDQYDVWYTPMYFLQGFNYRTQRNVIPVEESIADSIVHQEEPQVMIIPEISMDVILRETDNGQFEFDF